MLVDTDHHFAPNHTRGTVMALDTARQRGFGIAVSNPCFEVWLVLHHEDCVEPFEHADDVCARLRTRLGSYNKTRLEPTHFTLRGARSAIERARALESNPNDPAGYNAPNPGSRVYLLMERLLGEPASRIGAP